MGNIKITLFEILLCKVLCKGSISVLIQLCMLQLLLFPADNEETVPVSGFGSGCHGDG